MKVQSTVTEKAQQGGHGRECGTSSIYTVSAVREQKEKLSVQHLSPWKAQHTFEVGFPTSVKLCWRHSQRHTQICLHGDSKSSQADNEERVITTVEENSSFSSGPSFLLFLLEMSLSDIFDFYKYVSSQTAGRN